MPGRIHLHRFDDVVDVIGGPDEAAKILDVARPTINAWRTDTGLFPAEHYFVINNALYHYNCDATSELFAFNGHRPHPIKTPRARWSEARRQAIIDGQKRLSARRRHKE
jgi:hypothetical protein